MSQGSVTISSEQTLTDSLPLINAAFQILLSNSSGTAFPTTNLVVGMTCFRTDQSKLYRLINATPTWKLEFDFAKTFGVADSALLADLATALNANPANNRLVATIPNDYNGKFKFAGVKTATTIGLTAIDSIDGATLAYVVGLRGFGDSTGGPAHEIAFCSNGKVYQRYGATTTWGAWIRFASSADVATVASDLSTLSNTVAGKAPLVSPALTGTPTAPTANNDVNNTQIATTAFVRSLVASQAEAEAGTENTKYLTSLRVKQAISALTTPSVPHGQQLFTANGTFTVPTGVTKVYVTGCGGGGGGSTGSMGGGGGGGHAVINQAVTGLTPGSSITVTVGGGGAGAVNGNVIARAGGAGGTSSFGAYVSLAGGGGGSATAGDSGSMLGGSAGGLGGTAGQSGRYEYYGSDYLRGWGGAGGGCLFGAGGSGGMYSNSREAGKNGSLYGAGGGGGVYDDGTASAGGAGAQGFILVEW